MSVWRCTGPPENWITTLEKGFWALNEANRGTWDKLEAGDTVLFHSTGSSAYSSKITSGIVGYGIVGARKYRKDELWWVEEVKDSQNHWPYAFNLEKIYLFGNDLGLDLDTPVDKKSAEKMKQEVEALSGSGIPLRDLNERASSIEVDVPAFPVQGSISRINPIYERLLLEEDLDIFPFTEAAQDFSEVDSALSETADEELRTESATEALQRARAFTPTGPSHVTVTTELRRRRENQLQKRRVAKIEEYRCQVCGWASSYETAKGEEAWIVDVDHIVDKSKGGDESLGNLWVLCPNCHREKTAGVIQIDPAKKSVTRNGTKVELADKHLGW